MPDLQQDNKTIKLGLRDFISPEWREHEAFIKELAKHLEPFFSSNPIKTVRTLYNFIDHYIKISPKPPKEFAVQCKKGCSYCCYLRNHITRAEAIYISKWVNTHLDKESVSNIKIKASINQGLKGDDPEDVTHRCRCPFLSPDNNCMIYEARPFVCRTMYSGDVNVCKLGYEHPEITNLKNPFWLQPKLLCEAVNVAQMKFIFSKHKELTVNTMQEIVDKEVMLIEVAITKHL